MARAQEKNEKTDKMSDIRMDTNINIQKFYNQRNMYLTGSTLFLSLVLNYTYSVILDLLETEEKLLVLRQKSEGKGETTQVETQAKEVAKLREELISANKKVLDFETLKKQADQQHTEFNRLADEHAALLKASAAEEDSKKDL